MAVAVKIPDLNVVDIDTHTIIPTVNPGMAGVALLESGSREGVQTYSSIQSVGKDYDEDSYTYKFANNYFNNPSSTTFQVITYTAQSANSSQSNSSDPDKFNEFKTAINQNVHNTTSTNMFESIKTNFNDLFSTGIKAVNTNLGDIEQQFSSTHPNADKVNNDLTNISAALSSNASQNTSNDPAVNALIKYYDCGAEYFVFPVFSQSDHQTAIDLSNEVEGQSEHNLFLDIPTTNSEPDFSWLASIKNNQDTTFVSLPFSGDNSDYQFVSAILAERASEKPSSDLQYVHDLENIDPNLQPQDKYNFTPHDLDTYYKPYGVITYCYRNEVPMLTSGNSADGYQMSNVTTRDYLNMQVSDSITNLFIQAHDSGQDVHYDQNGVNRIIAAIGLVLHNAQQAGYIANYSVKNIDVDRISDAVKESGNLDGLGYTWKPVNNINHVEFHQNIVLPQL